MDDHKLVPVKIDWAMWQAAKPHLEAMVAQGGASATHFSDAFEDACKAAPTNPPEISSKSALRALVEAIRDEPCATGEPAESVQIGRLQVADELEALIEQLTSNIPDTTALKGN